MVSRGRKSSASRAGQVQSVRHALELIEVLQRFVGVRIDLAAQHARPALVLGAPRSRLPEHAYARIAGLLEAAAQRIAAAVA